MNKKLITAASIALAACVAIGGTIAYLWDSKSVTNSFTVGNVNITLTEKAGDPINNDEMNRTFKVTPGVSTKKDPKVTVDSNSEDAYVFVAVKNTTNGVITYEVPTGKGNWSKLELGNSDTGYEANTQVYYREVKATDKSREFSVFKNDQVAVSSTLEANDLENGSISGNITVTAYAIQMGGFTGENAVKNAWSAVYSAANPTDEA